MFKGLSHVMLWSKNLENTKDWYQDILGFQVSYYAPASFLSMEHINMGKLTFHADHSDHNIGKGPMPYYIVDDIVATKDFLESKGVKVDPIQQEGESPKHTWFWDCDGNVLGMEEY